MSPQTVQPSDSRLIRSVALKQTLFPPKKEGRFRGLLRRQGWRLLSYAGLLHEPGRYLLGIGLVVAGPQRHSMMVLPPAVRPTKEPPEIIGTRRMALAVVETSPPKPETLPTMVITPLAFAEPLTTILVGVTEQAEGRTAVRSAPDVGAFCTVSVIALRHDEAARITSDTRARTE